MSRQITRQKIKLHDSQKRNNTQTESCDFITSFEETSNNSLEIWTDSHSTGLKQTSKHLQHFQPSCES